MTRANRQRTERRHANRYFVQMPVVWENMVEEHTGTISDISANGYFVLCDGLVSEGESIRIRITNSKGRSMSFWSEVVNHMREVGFGASFVEASHDEKLFLQEFMAQLK